MTIRMSAILVPDLLSRFVTTTLTFEDLARLDGEELGSVTAPFASIGLSIKAVVQANANLNSNSRGVALKSKCLSDQASQHAIDLRFAKPQGGFGFFYRVPEATSLTVKVRDSDETILEENVFDDEEGYAGVIRAKAEIGTVRIIARTENQSSENPFFYIDDL